MIVINVKQSSIAQHGGSVRHAASRLNIKTSWIFLGVLASCSACQASVYKPASKVERKEVAPKQVAELEVVTPAVTPKAAGTASQAAKTSAVGGESSPAKGGTATLPSDHLSGKFRMTMTFDKGVKIKPKIKAEEDVSTQPDGSQVSLLEITSLDGKIVKCAQSLLNGLKLSQQPICTSNADEIKLVFADEKATFSASLEAVVRPDAAGNFKGPLLLRAVIIPGGKQIGELSLSRQ